MTKEKPNYSNGSENYARLFKDRDKQTPDGFRDHVFDIIEMALNDASIPVSRLKAALMGCQVVLNHAALEYAYSKSTKAQELSWRDPLLDREAQPQPIRNA